MVSLSRAFPTAPPRPNSLSPRPAVPDRLRDGLGWSQRLERRHRQHGGARTFRRRHGTVEASSTSTGGDRRPTRRNGSDGRRQRRYREQTPESVLSQCESLWPAWAAAGCRLVPLVASPPSSSPRPSSSPTPDQAAAALRAAAGAAAALRMSPHEREALLSTDRRVRGLVEALRVTRARGSRDDDDGSRDDDDEGGDVVAPSPPSLSLSSEAAPDAALGLALLGGREGLHDEELSAVLRVALGEGGRGEEATSSRSSSPSPPSSSRSAPAPLDLHPSAAADLLRAMAIARFRDERVLSLLDAVVAESARRGVRRRGGGGNDGGNENDSPSPSDVAAALWAFAVLQHQPAELLRGDDVGSSGGEGSESGGCPVAALLASAASPSTPRQRRQQRPTAALRPRDLASSLWALAALGRVSDSEAFRAGWEAALSLGVGADEGGSGGAGPPRSPSPSPRGFAFLGDAALSQLHLAGAAANLLPASGSSPSPSGAPPPLDGGWVSRPGSLPRLPGGDPALRLLSAAAELAWRRSEALRGGAAKAAASRSSSPSSPSTLQRQVVSSLSSILGGGATVREEAIDPVTWLSVDALVPSRRLARATSSSATTTTASTAEGGKEERPPFPYLGLALEVDGPSHDLRGPDGGAGVPTGNTSLKRRLLEAAGWRVVVVTHREWEEAGSGVAARAMLLRKLEDAGVV